MNSAIPERCAGLLLHPTSTPSGKLDEQILTLLDWMASAGLSVWQMLPLTPPADGISPYQGLSAFAMNPALLPDGWERTQDQDELSKFLENPPHWLDDYCLFRVIKNLHEGRCWNQWPDSYKYRDEQALAAFREGHADALQAIAEEQFALLSRWRQTRAEANSRGIRLFGDIPIFVAYDSVDVWSQPQQFRLDENLNPTVVTGVPPDYFSETGQRWGNPHYDWERMRLDDFQWWRNRMAWTLELFDMVRIDHFRGLEASWEITADEPTAINGHWVKAPGHELLSCLRREFDALPVIAEDLGIITEEVVALKQAFDLPGMSVLQFGFSGLPDNPHSPAEQIENSVVYTGTHDNETTLGWWLAQQDEGHKHWVMSQLDHEAGDMPWPLIQAAMSSPAQMAVVPMQDFLALDNQARMNTPGTIVDNWQWQYQPEDLSADLAQRIERMIEKAGRHSVKKP
ncbi:MAG: 4-alpha-glucanotransferase [Oceanobacter sp.]